MERTDLDLAQYKATESWGGIVAEKACTLMLSLWPRTRAALLWSIIHSQPRGE
jgi:hypothetical protein